MKTVNCIKRLIDKLDEKFNGNIDGNKLISAALNDYEKVWNSCIIDISITQYYQSYFLYMLQTGT